MSVVANDAVLDSFLRSSFGPVGRDLAARAERVSSLASQNASGEIIGVDTGDLLGGINVQVEQDAQGLFATVGTPARHRGFAYPTWQDQNGRPWLTNALRDGFRRGV